MQCSNKSFKTVKWSPLRPKAWALGSLLLWYVIKRTQLILGGRDAHSWHSHDTQRTVDGYKWHRDTQYTVHSIGHSSQRERRSQIALTRGCSAMMRAAVPRGWQPCFLNGGKVPSATKLFSKQRQGAVMTPNKLLFWGRSPSTIPACNSETRGNSLLSSFEASLACNLQKCLRCFIFNFIIPLYFVPGLLKRQNLKFIVIFSSQTLITCFGSTPWSHGINMRCDVIS